MKKTAPILRVTGQGIQRQSAMDFQVGGKKSAYVYTYTHTERDSNDAKRSNKIQVKKNLLTFLTNFPNIKLGGKNTR